MSQKDALFVCAAIVTTVFGGAAQAQPASCRHDDAQRALAVTIRAYRGCALRGIPYAIEYVRPKWPDRVAEAALDTSMGSCHDESDVLSSVIRDCVGDTGSAQTALGDAIYMSVRKEVATAIAGTLHRE